MDRDSVINGLRNLCVLCFVLAAVISQEFGHNTVDGIFDLLMALLITQVFP